MLLQHTKILRKSKSTESIEQIKKHWMDTRKQCFHTFRQNLHCYFQNDTLKQIKTADNIHRSSGNTTAKSHQILGIHLPTKLRQCKMCNACSTKKEKTQEIRSIDGTVCWSNRNHSKHHKLFHAMIIPCHSDQEHW